MFATRILSQSSCGEGEVRRRVAAYEPSPIDSSTHSKKQIVLWMEVDRLKRDD
jgi:hypothetical protein